jgi:predicted metal-dependent phosphoesterase TrpH
MKYCDLHTHTTASDGSDSPGRVVQFAAELGLAAVAVTDHDTVAGLPEAFEAGKDFGIEVLPGMELSVKIDHGTLHILGYLFDPDSSSLKGVLKRVQAARARRNPLILERLEKLGCPLSYGELEEISKGGQIGRPHIARAMLRRGYVRSIGEAFEHYLKKGGPAYVPKSILSSEEAITTIHEAGGLAVLAHPISLEFGTPEHLEELLAVWIDQGLDGIECYYSMHNREMIDLCLGLCKKYDLVSTGCSDYHGRAKPDIHIGTGTGGLRVPYSCVEALRERKARSRH